MRILVVQFSRMGDLAQTLPLLHALERQYPRCEIVVACRAGVPDLLRDAKFPHRFISIPTPVYGALGQLEKETASKGRELLAGFPELTLTFDVVINLSLDYESSVFTSLIPTSRRAGRVMTGKGEVRVQGVASRYLWAMVRHRRENLFNLCDLQMLMAGISPQPCRLALPLFPEALSLARQRLLGLGWDGNKPLVGIQLGASDFHRAWEPEGFAAAANLIQAQLAVDFVLFGDARERDRAERFLHLFSGTAHDLVGKTSLRELPALLAPCSLVIGNDTGTLHVAAAVGRPTLGIFFATAFFTETAPYGEGHRVLQVELPCSPCNASSRCAEQKCRLELNPRAVADAALSLLDPAHALPVLGECLHLYQSRFVENGTLFYESVGGTPASANYRQALASRLAWSPHFGLEPSRAEKALAQVDIQPQEIRASGSFATVASWAEAGMTAAQDMTACLRQTTPAAWRIAQLRSQLEDIPSRIAEAAPPLLRDYCHMVFMDLDAEDSSSMFEQLGRRFEEIRDLSRNLEKAAKVNASVPDR